MKRLRKNSTSQAVSESDEAPQEYADSDNDRGQNQALMFSVDNRRRIVSDGSDNSSEHDQEAPQPAEDDAGESRPSQDQDHENRPNHHNTAHEDLPDTGGPSKRPKCDTSQQPTAKHLIYPNQLAAAVLTTAAGMSLKVADSPFPLQTEAVGNVTVFMAERAVADDRPEQFLQPQQDDDWLMVDAVHLSANSSGASAAAGTAETNGAPAASDDATSEGSDSETEEQQQQDSRPVPFLEPAAAAAGSSDAPNPWSENGQSADQVVLNETAAATAKAGGSASTPAPTTARATAVDPERAASAQQQQARAQPLTQPDVATASGNHSKNVTQTPPSAAGEGAMVTEGLADAPQEPSVWYMVLLVIAAAAVAGVVAAAVAGGDVVAEVVRLLMYMRYRLL